MFSYINVKVSSAPILKLKLRDTSNQNFKIEPTKTIVILTSKDVK